MKFYLSKIPQINGDYEVHTSNCMFLPKKESRIELGEYYNCGDAIDKASEDHPNVNGCYFCSRLYHESKSKSA